MTKQRAQYLLDNAVMEPHGFCGFRYTGDVPVEHPHIKVRREDGITLKEDEYIRMIWSIMGPTDSYYDAVCAIAKGI